MRKNLMVVKAVFVKEMLLWFRYPSWLFTLLFLPYMMTGLFCGVGYGIGGTEFIRNFLQKTGTGDPVLYFTLGSVIFLVSTLVINDVGSSIRQEQLRGTFEYHYLSPASKVIIWLSYILPHNAISLIIASGSILPLLLIKTRDLSPLSLLITILVLIIGILPLFGIGMIIAALTIKFKEPWAITNILRAIISILSGFYYPLTILPHWLQLFSNILPTTHVTLILRDVLVYEKEILLSDSRIALLVLLSMAYLMFGFLFYRRWEIYARKTGELSKY